MNILDELLRRAYDSGFIEGRATDSTQSQSDFENTKVAALRRIASSAHVGAQSAQTVDEE